MTPSPPQIEAEARRLLATEMSADLRGQVGGNVEAIMDDLIHDPLGWQKIALRAIITALSPQPTSQDGVPHARYDSKADTLYVNLFDPPQAATQAIEGNASVLFRSNEIGVVGVTISDFIEQAEKARDAGPVPSTSQDDAGLCEDLRAKRRALSPSGSGKIIAKLINPDGPEAAARITTLSADVARMREALEKIAKVPVTGIAISMAAEIARAALSGETK